jgi:hypothetical protein
MLLRSVLLKSVLAAVPQDLVSQRLFCGIVIGILNDLAENCVVLVDEHNLTTGELFEAARRWPIKFRPSVLKLLTLLRTRHRFVKVASGYALADNCVELTCKHCIGIANAAAPAAVIASEPCVCATANLTQARAVSVHDYSTSPFQESRTQSRMYQLNRGEWDQHAFERIILVPLFSDAKSVKIYDRWIANSIETRGYDQRVLASTEVGERFRNALEWIIQVFLAASTQSLKRLEVFSAVDTRNKDRNEIAIILAALKAFETDIRSKYNFPSFDLIVKEETRQSRMLHSRYLLTDQVGVLMERGFDLFLDDSAMRDMKLDPTRDVRRIQDCIVAYCPEAAKVEGVVRTLPNLA